MSSTNRIPLPVLAAAILTFAAVIFLALVPVTSPALEFEEGEVASRTVRAPRDISFISDTLTARRQEEAANAAAQQTPPTYDPGVVVAQQSQLNGMLGRIRNVVEDDSLAPNAKGTALRRVDRLDLSTPSLTLLQGLTPEGVAVVDTESRRTLGAIFEQSLPASLLPEVRERAVTYVSPQLNRDMATLVAELVRPFIVTNLSADTAKIEAARIAARQGVAPVQVAFTKNQVIVEQDTPVTPEAREALRETGIIGSSWRPEVLVGGALLSLIVAATVAAGWRAFRPSSNPRQYLALGLAIAVPVFVLKVYQPLILPDGDRHFLSFAMPLSVAAMVVAGFVGAEIALLCAVMIALLAAFATVLIVDVSFVGLAGALDVARIALVTGVAGAAGVFAVRNAERLSQFLLGGVVVGLGVFITLVATWFIDPSRQVGDLPWVLLAAAINGGLCAFLSAGIFVTLGSLFGVTTRLQLLEMSQLSQPLMLRLQDEAPSTFQHSVIVANLAEKGAHVIGADSLLARVGCYYHDIGKLSRPGFFIENQLGGANPHDALDPEDSARIIADHVNDGIALARRYELPAKVAAFIPEHHGTRLVSYFYRRAAEQDPTIDPDGFRYPGPKPQSRETAIAMLADSSEAAVRSSPDHSDEAIDRLVDEVFGERLAEGQLDESDLTLRNVRDLAASFKATLRAVYHPRIEYPAPTETELFLRRLPFRREVPAGSTRQSDTSTR
jgi:putative nucleotidyltransferase with HDIG domain